MAWHIKKFTRNGRWFARIDTENGRTIKTGPASDSQDAAVGALMNLYADYFGVQNISVVDDPEGEGEKIGY